MLNSTLTNYGPARQGFQSNCSEGMCVDRVAHLDTDPDCVQIQKGPLMPSNRNDALAENGVGATRGATTMTLMKRACRRDGDGEHY